MAYTRQKKWAGFDVHAFLASAGVARTIVEFQPKDTLFSQGDICKDVMYIQSGSVKLSIVSKTGKEAVVAMLKPGDSSEKARWHGKRYDLRRPPPLRRRAALVIGLQEMKRVLHEEHSFSDRFIAYMLERNTKVEEDLVDQLFNNSEKRLARTLLLLARYGKEGGPHSVLPKISQETLAEMVGTTRSRVNFFLNKFKKLGFITYDGGLHVTDSLLTVVLRD